MTSHKSLVSLLTISLFIGLSLQCIHDEMEHPELQIAPHSEIDPSTAEAHKRQLTEWNPLRIHADTTYVNSDAINDPYIINQLIPSAVQFFSRSLKVPSLVGVQVSPNRTQVCGFDTPQYLMTTGVESDLVIIFTAEANPINFVASASACVLLDTTNRPVVARVTFNYNYVFASTQADFESHLVTTIHELTHALGFSYTLYDKFPTKPIFKSTLINSVTTFYFDGQPLTQMVKDHFGCDSMPGVLLEQQGSSGSVGSHFERRIFANEYMTASAQKDMRITKFGLGMLESSGWYQVDYSLTEPFYFGKGQGCGFYNGPCVTNGVANYPGYCSGFSEYGCTFHRKIGAVCGASAKISTTSLKQAWNYWGDNRTVSDTFADNCPLFNPLKNVDCEDPNAQIRRIIKGETYDQGSKCFVGTLYPGTALKKTMQYCLKYTCVANTNNGFDLNLVLGTTQATCTSAGKITVPGYAGQIECPDPNEFCSTIGIQYCKRGCLGRGTCQSNGACLCNPGFSGADCGFVTPL